MPSVPTTSDQAERVLAVGVGIVALLASLLAAFSSEASPVLRALGAISVFGLLARGALATATLVTA